MLRPYSHREGRTSARPPHGEPPSWRRKWEGRAPARPPNWESRHLGGGKMGRQATGDVRQSLPTCDKRKSESRDVAAHVACRVSRVLPLVIGNIGHWQHSHIGNIHMSARRFPPRRRRPVRGAQWLRLSTPKNFFRAPLPRPEFFGIICPTHAPDRLPDSSGNVHQGRVSCLYGTNHSQAQLSQDVDRP